METNSRNRQSILLRLENYYLSFDFPFLSQSSDLVSLDIMDSVEGWDYIIAGGGLAGCVLASRLKEYKASARILLIEA